MAEARGISQPDSAEGSEEQASVGVPAETKSSNRQVSRSSRARVRRDRTDGWQDDSHYRSGPRQFRDDDDGGLLQHEAVNLFQPNGNDGFLAPEIRPIA